jgi:hypothetical protein
MKKEDKCSYKLSGLMTEEEFKRKREEITDSQIATAAYFRKLDSLPDISSLPPFCFIRYKG